MAVEISEAKNWIYDALYARTTLRTLVTASGFTAIFAGRAPNNFTRYPRIVYNFQGGTDTNALGAFRMMTLPLFQVVVITSGQVPRISDVSTIDEELDAALQTGEPVQSGNYVIAGAQREMPIDRDDPSNELIHYQGGLYRLYISRV